MDSQYVEQNPLHGIPVEHAPVAFHSQLPTEITEQVQITEPTTICTETQGSFAPLNSNQNSRLIRTPEFEPELIKMLIKEFHKISKDFECKTDIDTFKK